MVETTDDEVILSRAAELLVALAEDKEQQGVSVSFLAVVNIVEIRSTLLLCGPHERALALAAFPEGQLVVGDGDSAVEVYLMNLGSMVSRKKDFVPAVSAAIKKGWSSAPAGRVHQSKSDYFDVAKY